MRFAYRSFPVHTVTCSVSRRATSGGIADRGVTSLAALGVRVSPEELDRVLVEEVGVVFGPIASPLEEPLQIE